MGALLESGLVGNIGLKHLKVIKEDNWHHKEEMTKDKVHFFLPC